MEFKELIKYIQIPQKVSFNHHNSSDFLSKYLLNKFMSYLSPDSSHYHLSINPAFSIELEFSLKEQSNLLKAVSLRDGVMPLMMFFLRNPSPPEDGPVFIIDNDLSCIVPEIWRTRVLLRSPYSNSSLIIERKKIIFFISPMKETAPLDLVEDELNNIFKRVSKDHEILLYFSSANLKGKILAEYDQAWGYKILEIIFSKFKSHKITVLNWKEYGDYDFNHVEYYFINPLIYYFTDSYLQHDISQRGATPLFQNKVESCEQYALAISQYHGFILHQFFANYESFGQENLSKQIFEIGMSEDERKVQMRSVKFINAEFSSLEFKDWTTDVARELYYKRQNVKL